jgi:hypothetical protein
MHEYQPWGFWGRWLKIPTKKIPKRQIDVEEETVPLNHPLRLDAMEIPVLIGRDGMPRPLWGGIPINATYVLAGVALSNLLFFGNMMFADTKNKTMKELCNWGAALFGTHPFFQWPMGYDTPVARAGGYSIGAALNVFLTKWWNPYLDWPGSVSFFESLNEGKLNDAFEILADLPLFSFVQGAEDGHFQEWDEKLVRSFRDKMDDLVKDVIVEYSKSPGMGEKYHIIANFFKMFEAKLAEYDGLSDGEKETVRLMATYIKASAEEYKVNGFGRVLKRVVEAHKEFFEGIPSVSFDDEKWDKFVEELNGGG